MIKSRIKDRWENLCLGKRERLAGKEGENDILDSDIDRERINLTTDKKDGIRWYSKICCARCVYTCSTCVEEVRQGGGRVHGSVKIAFGMMNCEGKGREREREPEEAQTTEAGKAIISAGRASEI